MSELKIIGKIKMIGELQIFNSGFQKREFVVTTEEQYPQDIKFEAIKEKAVDFEKHRKVDERVSVKFNVRGNEYNGKYYVNLQSWFIENMESNEAEGTSSVKGSAELLAEGEDDLPF